MIYCTAVHGGVHPAHQATKSGSADFCGHFTYLLYLYFDGVPNGNVKLMVCPSTFHFKDMFIHPSVNRGQPNT